MTRGTLAYVSAGQPLPQRAAVPALSATPRSDVSHFFFLAFRVVGRRGFFAGRWGRFLRAFFFVTFLAGFFGLADRLAFRGRLVVARFFIAFLAVRNASFFFVLPAALGLGFALGFGFPLDIDFSTPARVGFGGSTAVRACGMATGLQRRSMLVATRPQFLQ